MTDTGFIIGKTNVKADTKLDVEPQADIVPADDVTLVDGKTAEPKKDDKAASDQELSPADQAQKVTDDRLWGEKFPAFRGQRDATPVDIQARMWQNEALLQRTIVSPKVDENDSRPTVTPLPLIDPDAAMERFKQAVIDNDTTAQIEATAEIASFARGAVVTVNDLGRCNEFDLGQMQGQLNDLQIPDTIRKAGANTVGFEDCDVATAKALIDAGKVKDPALAVSHAVNARLVATNRSAPSSAAESAARKAATLKAASVPDSEPSPPVNRFIPTHGGFNTAQMKQAMRIDAQNQARVAE